MTTRANTRPGALRRHRSLRWHWYTQWVARLRGGATGEPQWKVENSHVEVAPGKGSIMTKEKFGDIQLHVEWQQARPV